jgi:hypothetical protein
MTLLERFNAKWTPEPFSGCWLWTGEMQAKGYARIAFNGKPALAHRVSWFLHNGQIPDGLDVCHRCDVRSCVNPAHLFIGTRRDNMQDALRKGRMKFPLTHGEHNTSAKLTEGKVIALRLLAKSGLQYKVLGEIFGITPEAASYAAKGITWPHVREVLPEN